MDSQVLIKHFWIVLAVVVFLIFFYKIDSFKSEGALSDFKADFYAKDVALLVNRMIASDNPISVEYKLDQDYGIELNKNEVVVKYKNVYQSKYLVIGDPSKISFKKVAEGVLITKNE